MKRRVQRVNQLIKKELSKIILREIDLPKDIFVTVTRVETTNNLIEARVYVSVLPETETSGTFAFLNLHIYGLQQKLNKQLRMRPVPKIKFLEEKKTAQAQRIEEILNAIKTAKP